MKKFITLSTLLSLVLVTADLNTTPLRKTREGYHRDFAQKITKLPKHLQENIKRDFKKELEGHSNDEIQSNDLIAHIQLSILTTYSRNQAERIIKRHTTDQQIIQNFINDHESNLIVALINDQPVDSYFTSEAVTHNALEFIKYHTKTTYIPSTYTPTTPTPTTSAPIYISKPPTPIYTPLAPTKIYIYDNETLSSSQKQRLVAAEAKASALDPLYTIFSARNIDRLKYFFFHSVLHLNKTTPVEPPLPHQKAALIILLDQELTHCKKRLALEIGSSEELNAGIEAVRRDGRKDIEQMQSFDKKKIEQIFHNLEDQVTNNTNTTCFMCGESFITHDIMGTAYPIVTKHKTTDTSCTETACKSCILQSQNKNNCQHCRTPINEQDLNTKLAQSRPQQTYKKQW